MLKCALCCGTLLLSSALQCQSLPFTVGGWSLQDSAKVSVDGAALSKPQFRAEGWYRATVPGTVLTTLVDNKVYPEPLYGENMRAIPESLNKTSYWYRTTFPIPAAYKGRLP